MTPQNADPIDIAVGRRVQRARMSAGLTQTALGQAIGVTFQQVQKYETGANRFSASRLVKAANALGTTAAALLGEDPTGAPDGMAELLSCRTGRNLITALACLSPSERDVIATVAARCLSHAQVTAGERAAA